MLTAHPHARTLVRSAVARLARLAPPRALRPVWLTLLALVALDVLVRATAGTWGRYDPDDYDLRVRACRDGRADAVVVGGSPVSEGLDPAALRGLAWRGTPVERPHALGLPGGTFTEGRHALERGVGPETRVVVYGATATDLNDSRQEPHGPNSLMGWGDLGRWVVARPESAEWAARHFIKARVRQTWGLWKHRGGVRLWAAHHLEGAFPGSFPELANESQANADYADAIAAGAGYAPNRHFVSRRWDAEKARGAPPQPMPFFRNYRVGGGHARYLDACHDWLAGRGVDFVVLDMPVTADLEGQYPAEFAAYRAFLAEWANRKGVPVIDGHRDRVGLTDADFSDTIHLNGTGAARLSAFLRRELDGLAEARP